MSLADKRNQAEQLRRELSAARVGQQETLSAAEEDIQAARLDKEIEALQAEIALTQGSGGSVADAKAVMDAAAAVATAGSEPVSPVAVAPIISPSAPALGLTPLDVATKGTEGKK